jgi:hypothetical protein
MWGTFHNELKYFTFNNMSVGLTDKVGQNKQDMGEIRNAYKILLGEPKFKDYWET